MPGGLHHSNGIEDLTEWHSIRPWRPTLTLSVREITSVSVTFVLSSPYAGSDAMHAEISLASLGLSSSEDDEQDSDTAGAEANDRQIVSNVLSKGLSVKVNGIPWQRVLMKIDEEDEAVIILFGLMPGRQYDIELGLLPGERPLRGQITTDAEVVVDRARSDHPIDQRPDASIPSATDSFASQSALSVPSNGDAALHSSSHQNGIAPPPSVPALTLEDRRLQLSHTLSFLTNEHAILTTSLKTARRESQKADAALRSEIEALKKASDRHAAGEHRARQKVLALQEAVKQAGAATNDIEAVILDIEAALPGLQERKEIVEKEWRKVKEEAARVRESKEETERQEKKRIERLQSELAALANRLDKLNGKREKLEGEGGVVPELEGKLRRLEEERERIESDPYGYEGEISMSSEGTRNDEEGWTDGSPNRESMARNSTSPERHNPPHHQHHPHIVHPRKRHTHPHVHHPGHQPFAAPRPIGRPDPIQRPPNHASRQSFPGGPHTQIPGVINLGNRPVLGRVAANSNSPASSSSASASSTPTIPPGLPLPGSSTSASNLSRSAAPFEPSAMARVHQPSVASLSMGSGGKSELNPDSAPFSPRSAVTQTASQSSSRSQETIGTRRGSLS